MQTQPRRPRPSSPPLPTHEERRRIIEQPLMFHYYPATPRAGVTIPRYSVATNGRRVRRCHGDGEETF